MVDSLIKVTSKNQITLPAALCKALHIRGGDYLEATVEGGKIILDPATVISRSQAWFWTSEWQEGEREASADIAQGRVMRFASMAEAVDGLNSTAEETPGS